MVSPAHSRERVHWVGDSVEPSPWNLTAIEGTVSTAERSARRANPAKSRSERNGQLSLPAPDERARATYTDRTTCRQHLRNDSSPHRFCRGRRECETEPHPGLRAQFKIAVIIPVHENVPKHQPEVTRWSAANAELGAFPSETSWAFSPNSCRQRLRSSSG